MSDRRMDTMHAKSIRIPPFFAFLAVASGIFWLWMGWSRVQSYAIVPATLLPPGRSLAPDQIQYLLELYHSIQIAGATTLIVGVLFVSWGVWMIRHGDPMVLSQQERHWSMLSRWIIFPLLWLLNLALTLYIIQQIIASIAVTHPFD